MDQAGEISEKDIEEALASLQLPHMSNAFRRTARTSSRTIPGRRRSIESSIPGSSPQAGFQTTPILERRNKSQDTSRPAPTVTILVCADIDLKSTSALAEYTLQQQQLFRQSQSKNSRIPQHQHYHFESSSHSSNHHGGPPVPHRSEECGFDVTAIDLIIAAGPCSRDEDLVTYYRGKQKRNLLASRNATTSYSQSYYGSSDPNGLPSNAAEVLKPFFRSPEETAALEGLMTAALSQLESIVCRVVYCPGYQDPLTALTPIATTTSPNSSLAYKRLTPNSRNIHQQWLSLAPGLGCAALFYLDNTDKLIKPDPPRDNNPTEEYRRISYQSIDTNYSYGDDDDYDEDDDDEHEEEDDEDADENEEDTMATLVEQLAQLRQSSESYCLTLEHMLQLAPPQTNLLFNLTCSPQNQQKQLPRSQSILVSHYVDTQILFQRYNESQQGDDSNLDDDNQQLQDCRQPEPEPEPQFSTYAYTGNPNDIDQELYRNMSSDFSNQSNESFYDAQSSDIDGDSESAASEKKAAPLPWPSDHGDFLQSSTAQQSLCLEIASGYAADHEPAWIDSNRNIKSPSGTASAKKKRHQHLRNMKGPVLLPGSLRERGEFCILELALTDQKLKAKQQPHPSSSIKNERRFAWEVQQVKFHRMA